MVRNLERGLFSSILECRIARKNSRDVENDGSLFKCKGVLRRRLVGERIEPNKLEMSPIYGPKAFYHVNGILMCCSSTGNRRSRSSNCP